MFYNKFFQLFKFVRKWVNIYIADDNLYTFLNLRFLISDKVSRDASFMDPSDLSPNSLLVAKLSLNFWLQWSIMKC